MIIKLKIKIDITFSKRFQLIHHSLDPGIDRTSYYFETVKKIYFSQIRTYLAKYIILERDGGGGEYDFVGKYKTLAVASTQMLLPSKN